MRRLRTHRLHPSAQETAMISAEVEAQILRLYHTEKWRVGTIARHVGVHHDVVRRVIQKAQASPEPRRPRPRMVDQFVPFIIDTLKRYPDLRASRLYAMLKERGYPGRPDHFRAVVAVMRPRPPAEAYLRLRTLPGEQAQVDWGHFGHVRCGKARRPLLAFVMVLSYSRAIFLRFYLGQKIENFLRGHEGAFGVWGAVPRIVLYDNLRSAVLARRGPAIQFNPTLQRFAGHYRFEVRPVSVARGNEKGRVERAISFIRTSFFAAREWRDLSDLNAQADRWCAAEARERRWPEDEVRTIREVFLDEQARLLALPATPFPTDERVEVHVGKTPNVRFDLNDYSVPHTLPRRTLCVVASLTVVRVLDGNEVVATHRRSFNAADQVEDPAHIQKLVEWKRGARRHSGQDRLKRACPNSEALLQRICERGLNLSGAVTALLRLLDAYTARDLGLAIAEIG